MTIPWNKGLTKSTNRSVRKISRTMKVRRINNFLVWRHKMRKSGRLVDSDLPLKINGDLAELIGVALGDGHIWKFPRTEELSIFSNSNNHGFVKRYSRLVELVFGKKPAVTIHSGKNCYRIRIYQKGISRRLGVPFSPRKGKKITIPTWIIRNDKFIVRYLRGLYEAEGSFSVHEATYTHKFLFSNKNKSMLENVYKLLAKLGFHPHRGSNKVQISRKDEVYKLIKLIEFRKY